MAAFMGLHGANRILHAGIHRILIRGIRLGATHQALPAGASVAHQVVALPPVGDGYAGAAVRMRLCGCSHDGEVAATPGRKTRFLTVVWYTPDTGGFAPDSGIGHFSRIADIPLVPRQRM